MWLPVFFLNSMKYYWFIWIIWLLTSCTQIARETPSQNLWESHYARLKALTHWHLQGSLALTTEQESWSARVYWDQQGPVYQLRFNAPLGQGSLKLDGNEHQVRMKTAKNETLVARDPETLVAKVLKLEIPVSGLYYWIRGIPAPSPLLEYELNENGYLHILQQHDWHIEYGEYMKIAHLELPRKMFLYNSRFKVKIVISQWLATELSPISQ